MLSTLCTPSRLIPILALSFLPSLQQAARPAAPSASDTLAKLIPPEAEIYIQIPSLDRFIAAARKAVTAVVPDQNGAVDIDTLLRALEVPGTANLIDHTKPIAVCLVLPEAASEGPPMTIFLVPSASADEYARSVASTAPLMSTTIDGNYVRVSPVLIEKTSSAPAAIALGLPEGEIVARIDVKRLVEKYRAQIDAGLDQMETEFATASTAEATGFDMAPLMKLYAGMFHSIVDSGESLDLYARLDGDRLELREALTAREGSALASFASKEKTEAKSLSRLLDPDATLSFVAGLDMKELTKRFSPFFGAVVAMYPEPLRAGMKKIFDGADDFAAQMGSAVCASGDLDAGGMRFAYYLHAHDAAKLIALYKSMLTSMPGFTVDPAKDSEVDGVPVTRMRFHFDTKAMLPEKSKQLPEEKQAELQGVMDKLYGKDGLALTFGTKGDVTVMVLGGDDAYLHRSLARMSGGGKAPASVAHGLGDVGELNPCFVVRYDFGRLMSGMRELMGPMMEGVPFPMADSALAITAWGGVDGRVWRGALAVDLGEIGKMVRSMRGPTTPPFRRQAMADITALAAALDDYALNNAMKYPDSLEVLVTPDVNGHTYINQQKIPKDPWNNDYQYDPPGAGHPTPRVYSLGRDGKPGGEGEDADIDNTTESEEGK